jgi:AcrR family transcriptional regulator
MISNTKNHENDIKQRILDAAEAIFAQKGYSATSIRDITELAECNIAAVNYHFNGKENLYKEIFERKTTILRDRRVKAINDFMAQNPKNPDLESFLRMYASAFFEPIIDNSVTFSFFHLMMREWVAQILPHTMFREKVITPITNSTVEALVKTVPNLSYEQALHCTNSLMSQLINALRQMHMVSSHLNPGSSEFPLEQTIEHIVKFSTAGIRAIANGGQK